MRQKTKRSKRDKQGIFQGDNFHHLKTHWFENLETVTNRVKQFCAKCLNLGSLWIKHSSLESVNRYPARLGTKLCYMIWLRRMQYVRTYIQHYTTTFYIDVRV